MASFVPFLVFCQSLGALTGALSAVWGEVSYLKAMRNGKISEAEQAHLRSIGHGLRYGMTLLLLASLGLTIAAYQSGSPLQPALTPSYWTLIALALTIVSVCNALARGKISYPLASASLYGAWWFLVYLSFGWLALSFGAAVMSFVIATAIFYAVLYWARLIASPG